MSEYEKTPWSKEAFVIKNANEKVIQELDIYKNKSEVEYIYKLYYNWYKNEY